jgi:hypothetical protein
MNPAEKTGAMTIGAIAVAFGIGFGTKDWSAGLTAFGVLLYAIPFFNK